MATSALITVEQYLSSHFEREPELVHGLLVERPLRTFSHGSIQLEIGSRLRALRHSYPAFAGVEVRVRLAPDLIRIPDISMWIGAAPADFPSEPPFLVVEIISPDDRLTGMLAKFEEYRTWGVQHIWLVEPELKRLQVYANRLLTDVTRFDLPQFSFTITAEELFA